LRDFCSSASKEAGHLTEARSHPFPRLLAPDIPGLGLFGLDEPERDDTIGSFREQEGDFHSVPPRSFTVLHLCPGLRSLRYASQATAAFADEILLAAGATCPIGHFNLPLVLLELHF
jgi:hypothetical protein